MAELLTILAKGAMRLSTPADQSINDSSWTVMQFDTVTDQRGGFICDPDANAITVPTSGLYAVNHGVDAIFPGAEMLDLIAFVNGVEYSPYPLSLQGRANNKPVSIFWQSTVSLNGGDVIDLRCINGAAGTFNLHILRMYMAIIKEH